MCWYNCTQQYIATLCVVYGVCLEHRTAGNPASVNPRVIGGMKRLLVVSRLFVVALPSPIGEQIKPHVRIAAGAESGIF